ncbi:hypothetical protein TG4357_02646 [Thalassovita gelatinovora]|uniref:Uncharacterized protein n=1 Tax=Thalassovita gelatinovora TaxID=53501 RepID=A0A0P1FF87_THAGE|nr:hypothetical protein [Thalassovita gelatinovora]QIZ79771.1 hypothetical protein HFZ77_04395 [Thalassovita gelatinovora]CUH66799.1 hypothetical protein TG4357_02646 [Thalassovita gelatinovora]SEQ42996.1 hypothetical protein SAMN04488043_105183 [Thalassovita gelatinovora]
MTGAKFEFNVDLPAGVDLPTLTEYSSSAAEAQMLAQPELREFFDATDTSRMTLEDTNRCANLVGVKNGLDWTAATTARPTYIDGAFGTRAGLYFDGIANTMQSVGLFTGAPRWSASMVFFETSNDGTSKIILTDTSDSGPNVYHANYTMRAYNNDVSVNIPNIAVSATIVHVTADTIAALASIISGAISAQDDIAGSRLTPPNGDATLGSSGTGGNFFKGYVGSLAIWNADLWDKTYLRDLFDNYAKSHFRL